MANEPWEKDRDYDSASDKDVYSWEKEDEDYRANNSSDNNDD